MSERSERPELVRLREVCLALPEVTERLSHGSPAWFIRDKKTLAMYLDDHHGDGRLALWCPAPPGVQEAMVTEEPERFFRPPYVGPSGWLGVRLDREPDWDEIAGIVEDAYRKVAPKRLAALLDSADPHPDGRGVGGR
ncbi:MAG TPA: MmcQ/YjbR family DNA-binding protein [Acidimicrobiales bacterium]|nr:MmcQ/YjbR family DNA-binding protein [Acidimicrobiales bacterium]